MQLKSFESLKAELFSRPQIWDKAELMMNWLLIKGHPQVRTICDENRLVGPTWGHANLKKT